MKILIFIIIIIIAYFIFTQVKVFHIDTLPYKQQKELRTKAKMRSMLLDNYVKRENINKNKKNKAIKKLQENRKNENETESNLSTKTLNFLNIIDKEYVNPNFKFNISNQPLITKYFSKYDDNLSKKYLPHIKYNIESWNNDLPHNFKIIKLIPIIISEAGNEFIIKVYIEIYFNIFEKTIYLKADYYGEIEKSDDFDNDDVYILQLIKLNQITKLKFKNINEKIQPFMNMKDQLKYVDYVNNQHKNEFL